MTSSRAYYNEIDPYAAAWLRNLIQAGHIAPGEVDERDIRDVRPSDLAGFDQCHFFAGIGIWSAALRDAGVPDDDQWWSASCPCQPFSAAGKGGGFDDERHLWPAFHWLVDQCRPVRVVGEQVASKDGLAWLDLVQSDMEGTGYAFGAVDTCAAGFGAPHIRQRLYWVADANDAERRASVARGHDRDGAQTGRNESNGQHRTGGSPRIMADALSARLQERVGHAGVSCGARGTGAGQAAIGVDVRDAGGMADADGGDARTEGLQRGGQHGLGAQDASVGDGCGRPGPVNGYWRVADWLHCRDGRWRPVETGTFPLAHGERSRVGKLRADQESEAALQAPPQGNRVGRLRAYGNQIVRPQAAEFVRAVRELNVDN